MWAAPRTQAPSTPTHALGDRAPPGGRLGCSQSWDWWAVGASRAPGSAPASAPQAGGSQEQPGLGQPPPPPPRPAFLGSCPEKEGEVHFLDKPGRGQRRLHVAVPRRPQRRSLAPMAPSSLGTLGLLHSGPFSNSGPLLPPGGHPFPGSGGPREPWGGGLRVSPQQRAPLPPCSPAPLPRPRPGSSSVCQARPGTPGTAGEQNMGLVWCVGKRERPAHRRCSDSPSHPGREDTGDVGAVAWHVHSGRCVNVAPAVTRCCSRFILSEEDARSGHPWSWGA